MMSSTNFYDSTRFVNLFTTVCKAIRICGLELADMLATPMKYLTLKKYGLIDSLSDNFTKTVLEKVFCKVRKSPFSGSSKGYGIKLV